MALEAISPVRPVLSGGGNGCALVDITAGSPPAQIEAARELLLEYGSFVAAQPPTAAFCYGSLRQEARELPHSYLDRGGGAMLVSASSGDLSEHSPVEWIGFIAWRSLPGPELNDAWELKRLWVRPQRRGTGAGRTLVQAVVDRARQAGKRRLLLDTVPEAMPAALRLYAQMGFEECPAYSGPPVPGIVYMAKTL